MKIEYVCPRSRWESVKSYILGTDFAGDSPELCFHWKMTLDNAVFFAFSSDAISDFHRIENRFPMVHRYA